MPALQEEVDDVFLVITGEIGEGSIELDAIPHDPAVNSLRLGHPLMDQTQPEANRLAAVSNVLMTTSDPRQRRALFEQLIDAGLPDITEGAVEAFSRGDSGAAQRLFQAAIREGSLPAAAPTELGIVIQPPEGDTVTMPDTPQMRSRQTVFDNPSNVTPETQDQLQARRDEVKALDEESFKASPFYRQGIPWDAGMTEDRAAALATMSDAKKVREFYAEKRPILAFLGNMAGQAVDPINYVPVAGPTVKAAAVARVGKIGGAALVGALDAAANTAIFGIGTADVRAKFGDDVSWQATISQVATAALIGGAFGAVGGFVAARSGAKVRGQIEDRLSTLRNTQEARVALNQAIDGVAHGEDIRLSANATDTLVRVASEVENLSRAYDQVLNTPTGPVNDPLVRLTPEEIEGTILARGAFKGAMGWWKSSGAMVRKLRPIRRFRSAGKM